MFNSNKICSLLNIKFPIIQGGMAWSTDSKLACAVSDAGGLGIIGCGGRDPDWVIDEIDKSKKITSRQIGLNVAMNDSNAIDIVEIAITVAFAKQYFFVCFRTSRALFSNSSIVHSARKNKHYHFNLY